MTHPLDHRSRVKQPRKGSASALKQMLRKMDPASDAELLTRYSEQYDPAAFEEIVDRYGPMVMGVARRKKLQKPDQEDVFQATFWLLSRNSRKIRERDKLAGWLYQVACRLSKKCEKRTTSADLESVADSRIGVDPVVAAGWRELTEVLDSELLRLSPELRTPLVICLLEGATQEEAALRLNCSYATLRRRFDRGRAILRQRLERRGMSPHSVAMFVLPPSLAFASVPTVLAQSVASFGAGNAPVAMMPESAKSLLSNTAVTMKPALFAAAFALSLGLAVVTANRMTAGQLPQQQDNSKAVVQDAPKPKDQKVEPIPGTSEMRFRVLDENQKPLSGALLHFSLWAGKDEKIPDGKTDTAGLALVQRPNDIQILRVWCSADGYATLFRGWETGTTDPNNPLPAEFTFPMKKATTIGGRVVDPEGRGIAGVAIEVASHEVPTADLPAQISYSSWLSNGTDAVRTDKDGRWVLHNVPAPAKNVVVNVSHPEYVSDRGRSGSNLAKDQGITIAQLREKSSVVRLTQGTRITGVIMDDTGKPVPKAVVVFHDNPYFTKGTQVRSDDNGRYLLPTLPPGLHTITVAAVGHSPIRLDVNAAVGPHEQNIRLSQGNSLKVHVVDESGKPVAAYFSVKSWRGKESIYTHRHPNVLDMKIPNRANADGHYEWSWAPSDTVKFLVMAQGFQKQELELIASAAVHQVTLKSSNVLAGRVTDAKTGRPIPKFRVYQILEFSANNLHGLRNQHHVIGEAGAFRIPLERADTDYRVLIEAEGYRSAVSKASLIKNGIREQDFALEPAAPMVGRILDSDGKPVAGAIVSLANQFQTYDLADRVANHNTVSDDTGTFRFPAQPEDFSVVANSALGFVRSDFSSKDSALGDLALKPWARLRGTLWQDNKPIPNQDIFISPLDPPNRIGPRFQMTLQVKTDEKGHFEVARIPAGPTSVKAYLGPWEDSVLTSSECLPILLAPGENVNIDLGKMGTTVVGNIRLTGERPKGLDLRYSLNSLVRRTPNFALPKEWKVNPIDFSKVQSNAFLESDSALAHRTYFVKPTPEGQFRIHGVPAGEYWLALRVFEKPEGCLVNPVAEKMVPVSVTPAQAARGEISVPEIEVFVRPPLKIGNPLPEVSLKDARGKPINLADFKGRHVLLHGWAGWCTACARNYPAIRTLATELPKGKVAFIGLNLDLNPATTTELATKYEFPWPHAVLAVEGKANETEAWSIGSIPLYMVLAPDGTLSLRTNNFEDVTKFLNEHVPK